MEFGDVRKQRRRDAAPVEGNGGLQRHFRAGEKRSAAAQAKPDQLICAPVTDRIEGTAPRAPTLCTSGWGREPLRFPAPPSPSRYRSSR